MAGGNIFVLENFEITADILFALIAAGFIDEVAEIMRPHRKPQMSDEQREAVSERLRQYQFQPKDPHRVGTDETRDARSPLPA